MRKELLGAFAAGVVVTAAALYVELPARLALPAAQADAGLYAATNWSRVQPSTLNISVFAFSDRNRNGKYDVGDKPVNRLAVRLTRPDASTRIERANINGYANFKMGLGAPRSDISEVDTLYRFEALPPPGWEITTGNAVQATEFREIPGSIAGMGARTPPQPVGLAPEPRVSGRLDAAGQDGLVARHAELGEQRLEVDADGHFAATLAPGTWTLSGPGLPDRVVSLDYAPVVLGTRIAPGPDAAAVRERRVVDFEDIDRSSLEKLPGGYAGLGWDYLLAVDNQFYKGPGYVNGLMSGARVAYNSSGHPVTVSAWPPAQRFDFVGAYFSVAWNNAEGETLILRAYRDGELLAEDRMQLTHLGPQYFQADYEDISRLELETLHYWQFVVDDLEFRLR